MKNCHNIDVNFPLITVSHTDSSINYLNGLYKKYLIEEFTTVLVYYQTSGRGQRGNSWESEPNSNLLFSFIVYPDFIDIKHQFILSQIISISIKETLDSFAKGFSIKWPNDIYWKNFKICGILIENDLQGNKWIKSITGIGINVNQKIFESNAPNPVSLIQITGQKQDLFVILSEVMNKFIAYYAEIRKGNFKNVTKKYHNYLFRNDGLYPYRDKDGAFIAQIEEVLPEGFLVLMDESGKRRVYGFKEVEYLIN